MAWKYSGGAANADPDASLGGVESSEDVSEALNGLFDDVSGAESEAGDTEYRCIYYVADQDLTGVRIYIPGQPSGDDSFKVGKDLAGLNGEADEIADEDTAPDPAVTFATAADYDNGIVLGDMDAGDSWGIWIERTVPAEASAGTSAWTIRARGESAGA